MTKTKTKTEQLREEIAEKFCEFLAGDDWVHSSPGQKRFYRTFADTVLAVCKKAGLAFVVEDTGLPYNSHSIEAYYDAEFTIAVEVQAAMLKAGFRQFKKIELT